MSQADLVLDSDSEELEQEAQDMNELKGPEFSTLTELDYEKGFEFTKDKHSYEEQLLSKHDGKSSVRQQENQEDFTFERIRAAIAEFQYLEDEQVKYFLIELQNQELLAHEIFYQDEEIRLSPSYIVLLQKSCENEALLLFSGQIIAANCIFIQTNGQNCISIDKLYLPDIQIQKLQCNFGFKLLVLNISDFNREVIEKVIEHCNPTHVLASTNVDCFKALSSLSKEFNFQLILQSSSLQIENPELPNEFITNDEVIQNPRQFSINGVDFFSFHYPFNKIRDRLTRGLNDVEIKEEIKSEPKNDLSQSELSQSNAMNKSKILIKSSPKVESQQEIIEKASNLLEDEQKSKLSILLSSLVKSDEIQYHTQVLKDMSADGFEPQRLLSFVLSICQFYDLPFLPAHLPTDYAYSWKFGRFNIFITQSDNAMAIERIEDLIILSVGSVGHGQWQSFGILEATQGGISCQIVGIE